MKPIGLDIDPTESFGFKWSDWNQSIRLIGVSSMRRRWEHTSILLDKASSTRRNVDPIGRTNGESVQGWRSAFTARITDGEP